MVINLIRILIRSSYNSYKICDFSSLDNFLFKKKKKKKKNSNPQDQDNFGLVPLYLIPNIMNVHTPCIFYITLYS